MFNLIADRVIIRDLRRGAPMGDVPCPEHELGEQDARAVEP
jgi:hypothetical protein